MIGIYNYTVILTYMSLISAGIGIAISLSGEGHPYVAMIFLLFSALCDAFDGYVARSKKDRTEVERNFGIQIDSLVDVVAFGVLPAAIGLSVVRRSALFGRLVGTVWAQRLTNGVVYAVLSLYVLAALIRLAYFNVTEEERQKEEGGQKRKYYIGVPVTTASFSFSLVVMLDILTPIDAAPLYMAVMLFMAIAFVSNIKVPKLGAKGISVMVGIGFLWLLALLAYKLLAGN